jgi:hypothetical protein
MVVEVKKKGKKWSLFASGVEKKIKIIKSSIIKGLKKKE